MSIVLKPRMSEKSYNQATKSSTYVFDVPTSTNKLEIAVAVEKQFKVKVKNVRTNTIKGKQKRWYRKGGKNMLATRSDIKRAYVTLLEGTIPMFEAVEEAMAEATKEKADTKDSTKEDAPKKRSGLLRRSRDTSKNAGAAQVRRVQNKSGDA